MEPDMTIRPQPKRDKYDRMNDPKSDTRTLPHRKAHPDRDPRFRKFVIAFDCALAGEGFGPCDWNRREAAHTRRFGMAMKGNDSSCAPLCAGPNGHHRRFDKYELPAEAVAIIRRRAAELRAEWEAKEAKRAER